MSGRRIAWAGAAFLTVWAALGAWAAGAPVPAPTATGAPAAVRPTPATTTAPAPSDADLLRAYLPKDDLGVTRFLVDHPQTDGRGVLVAVLDTGIDLHHPGLRYTPSGERKIVDVYDATDNGLIDLPISISSHDSVLTGWTGRAIRLGLHRAEDGNYRLGRLSAREVLPRSMTRRLLDLRGEERRRAIDAWEARVEDPTEPKHKDDDDTTRIPSDRAETYREARRGADRDFHDPGPVYDLVAWRSGGAWRLVIDTDGDGNLSEETELLPYRERGDLALFPAPVELSVALASIADDGARAVLMFDEGGHGTHVAGIIGAYYGPDDPMNGLAPGVRFLSVKIGNGRLGGGTSHDAIAKGITWAVAHGAMVANISFGGTSHFDDGREIVARYLDAVVQNHGIFITMSAGNEGPGLSTVGAAGTARRVFTLGAAISQLTMLTSYGGLASTIAIPAVTVSTIRRGSGVADAAHGIRMFNFSSRGPLANGSSGVDFVSPGAAVSPLPTWLLTRNENWNGTSMAAPQAAGCLALLICAAQQDRVPVSPARVDRALRASAIPLPGVPSQGAVPPVGGVSFVEQGAGLINLPGAYTALRALADAFPVTPPPACDSCMVPNVGVPATRDPLTGWRASVTNPTGTGEGIYDRNETATEPYWRTIRIAPDLPERGAEPLRTRFLRVVRLESTVPWMEAPPQTSVPASGASLRVRIDPAMLHEGLNAGQIRVRTVAAADAGGATVTRTDAPGSEVDIPVVLVRPERVAPPDHRLRRTFDLPPGERRAVFVEVPEGATRMSIHAKERTADPANAYAFAATTVDMRFPPPALRGDTGLSLQRDEERIFFQRVEGGTTVEVAVFAHWVNAGTGSLETTIGFDGLEGPGGLGSTATLGGESSGEARWGEPPVQIPPGRDGSSVPLRSLLADTHVDVDARFDGRVEPLALTWSVRPDSVHPVPLEGGRDAIIALGRGLVRLDRDETVTCDLREAPEMEDFLDDCFFRLFAPTGQMVDAGNISSGPFRMRAARGAPPTGWYRIEISVFGCGRDFLRDTAFLSPEIVRGGSFGRVTPFPDPVAGRMAGADSSWSFDFPRGWARNVYLRTRGLPDDGVFTGSLTLRDRGDAPPLLRIPLRADTRAPRMEVEPSVHEALDRLEEPVRRLLADPPQTPGSAAVLASLDRADALQQAWEGGSAKTSGRWWDRVFLRCDLGLRHGVQDETARNAIAQALDEREKQLPKNLPKEKDRQRAGQIALRRTSLALANGNAGEARRQFDRAERFGFGGNAPEATKAALLLAEKKPLEALAPLRAAMTADPWNPHLARDGIDLMLNLGWTDLADESLAAWPDRFPRETAVFFELARRRAGVRPAEETRAGR
jgi:subtilisin family serine protease